MPSSCSICCLMTSILFFLASMLCWTPRILDNWLNLLSGFGSFFNSYILLLTVTDLSSSFSGSNLRYQRNQDVYYGSVCRNWDLVYRSQWGQGGSTCIVSSSGFSSDTALRLGPLAILRWPLRASSSINIHSVLFPCTKRCVSYVNLQSWTPMRSWSAGSWMPF